VDIEAWDGRTWMDFRGASHPCDEPASAILRDPQDMQDENFTRLLDEWFEDANDIGQTTEPLRVTDRGLCRCVMT
jgi:hypothetical protein